MFQSRNTALSDVDTKPVIHHLITVALQRQLLRLCRQLQKYEMFKQVVKKF